MSTFLELCQRARYECGLAGDRLPASTVSQTGAMKKLVERTSRAWVEVQASKPSWKFLRHQKTKVLVPTVRQYDIVDDLLITDLDHFDRENLYIFEDSTADEKRLVWLDYQSFRRQYRTHPDGRPTRFVEGLDGVVEFDRTPDLDYTVTMDYVGTPQILAANADEPLCPSTFHDVIVWKSVMMFAGNEEASQLYIYAKSMYDPLYTRLVANQAEMPVERQHFPLAIGLRTTGTSGHRSF